MDGGDYESGDDGQTEALTGVDVAQSGATLRRETATNGVGILPGGEHRPRFSTRHLPAPNHHVAVTKAVAGRSGGPASGFAWLFRASRRLKKENTKWRPSPRQSRPTATSTGP